MGFFFRRSVSLGGGVRVNVSNSGVGVSAGVPGFRVGIGQRGRCHVHCGRNGIYYRMSFGSGGTPAGSAPSHAPGPVHLRPPNASHQPRAYANPTIPSNTLGPSRVIDSSDVDKMVDSSARELLAEISAKHKMPRYHRWLLLSCAVAFLSGLLGGVLLLAVLTLPVGVVGTPLLWLMDRRRKRIDLSYNMDTSYESRYRALVEAFNTFGRSHKVWLVQTEAEVLNRKYHAGASLSVDRKAVRPALALPVYFISNIKPPMLPAGRQTLYFLPDFVLVIEGRKVGAVSYQKLLMHPVTTSFIESESVPRDSRRVGQTWRFVNKNGTPDRRFSNNRQLPVMEYGQLSLQSASGLNERFQTSNPQVVHALAAALSGMAAVASAPALPVGLL